MFGFEWLFDRRVRSGSLVYLYDQKGKYLDKDVCWVHGWGKYAVCYVGDQPIRRDGIEWDDDRKQWFHVFGGE